ncbi:MAG: GNAT family N-acetyltransferase [Saprospiraceae bacterium]|nr:GNAT family N-acetyltransferase [Saprospiraceae bacterium]
MILNVYDAVNLPSSKINLDIVNFLFKHLDQYGDDKESIEKAMDYALKKQPSFGGYIITIVDEQEIVGATVVNKTGMDGYIPENILVYIAIHKDFRGKGIGKKLMSKAIEMSNGDIALHVEPDNPAKILYEKLGFKNKYLEMRLIN